MLTFKNLFFSQIKSQNTTKLSSSASNLISKKSDVLMHNVNINVLTSGNVIYFTQKKSMMGNNVCLLKSKDLIKPLFNYDISWSSGMIANLLFNTANIYIKKTLNVKNARRDWSLWKYTAVLWIVNTKYFCIHLKPMSIRTRRFLKNVQPQASFITISHNWELYKTPKRSIKRWLKKKYTTQSWR